ncbi:hypothetical protein [Blastopirellula marina]|uniref:hypothetical protein n=1 Tax=Blastopirellula marina TaxID=124 RepID=UPI0011B06016|nr:hypothetical protein [Blastopirellula marina]
MRNHRPNCRTESFSLAARSLQPPLPDGSLLMPVNDPVDALHTERMPGGSIDRHREAVILDHLFWASIALLMITGVGLQLCILS